MILHHALDGILSDLHSYLAPLDDVRYSQAQELLSGASIGQHTRHVVEFFQCLLDQGLSGHIDYDLRVRDTRIETDTAFATECLEAIRNALLGQDLSASCSLSFNYGDAGDHRGNVQTTLERELVYNIEHAIHHLAIIKIGLRHLAPEIDIPQSFGVAPSTIRYRKGIQTR